MRIFNWLISWTGYTIVPRHSVKMLIEYSNVLEARHPSRLGAAFWLRRVAQVMPLDETDRNSKTVAEFFGR